MAIYHCSAKIIGRSSGRSAVGAAAYRSGEKLENERDGLTHDYTHKGGIEHTEIMTPENAPEWAKDRERLWNEVEKVESAKDAQLAREIEVALPIELDRDQQKELLCEYVKENFTDKGMVADIALHDKGDGNPHAHIMLTTRPFEQDGSWGKKQKKIYILDKDGNKQYDPKKKTYKCKTVKTTDWDKTETLEKWRENWAEKGNQYLERAGHDPTLDHRSYEDQGIEKIPQVHEGAIQREMKTKAKKLDFDKIEINQEIANKNRSIELINQQQSLMEKQLKAIKQSPIRKYMRVVISNLEKIPSPMMWDGECELRKEKTSAKQYLAEVGEYKKTIVERNIITDKNLETLSQIIAYQGNQHDPFNDKKIKALNDLKTKLKAISKSGHEEYNQANNLHKVVKEKVSKEITATIPYKNGQRLSLQQLAGNLEFSKKIGNSLGDRAKDNLQW